MGATVDWSGWIDLDMANRMGVRWAMWQASGVLCNIQCRLKCAIKQPLGQGVKFGQLIKRSNVER